ncbi:hypothetical protein AAFF_G00035600 [Aldrovandia affinis]|uniref:Uncharacterized protein n=1 Tax=Aldrovandia affinis TaxID=143900 RepID=A0AAD7S359_9TELE|nr:hypothetical protein AAFF_G00035600 [Aldrovandia affinis]
MVRGLSQTISGQRPRRHPPTSTRGTQTLTFAGGGHADRQGGEQERVTGSRPESFGMLAPGRQSALPKQDSIPFVSRPSVGICFSSDSHFGTGPARSGCPPTHQPPGQVWAAGSLYLFPCPTL